MSSRQFRFSWVTTPTILIAAGGRDPGVQAPIATVTIQKLHFVRPVKSAIVVNAVSGLIIVASCRIEGFTVLPSIQFSSKGVIVVQTW